MKLNNALINNRNNNTTDDDLKFGFDDGIKAPTSVKEKEELFLNSVKEEASNNGVSDYIVELYKLSDNALSENYKSNVIFDLESNYNQKMYDIVLFYARKFELNKYEFIISRNDSEHNENTLKNGSSYDVDLLGKEPSLLESAVSNVTEQAISKFEFFKNVTINKSNNPQGNISDYMLIKLCILSQEKHDFTQQEG